MTTDRFDLSKPAPPAADLGRVHFIAIGGAGMSGVARLMLAAGVPVSGSDAKDSETLRRLEAAGARVHVGHDARHVVGVDTVVVSSAVREDNVELAAARGRGLRVLHRSQGLASLTRGRQVIAVAGANGKSTTTSMLVVALTEAGADPAFASGAEIPALGTNAALGSGESFVVEADESDGTFVVYRPDVALVTNVQPDHLDFYGDFDAVQAAYRRFVDSMRTDGLLVACADDPGATRLAEYARAAGRRVLTYGAGADCDIRISDCAPTATGARARLSVNGADHHLILEVPGQHNLENAAGAFGALTRGCGLDHATALAGLAAFTGAARRFESHGDPAGIRVIDDYAHNAPKVRAAVRTGAELAARRGGRLVVVFQPHLFTRTRDFADDFADALAAADEVVLLDIFGAREDPVEGVSSELIAEPLRGALGEAAVHRPPDADAMRTALGLVRRGDVLMTVGAGDVTVLAGRIARALDAPDEGEERT